MLGLCGKLFPRLDIWLDGGRSVWRRQSLNEVFTMGEVSEVLIKLLWEPGLDRIHPEMLKAVGIVGLPWFMSLQCHMEDWDKACGVADVACGVADGAGGCHFKRGTSEFVPAVEHSHFSAFPGKFTAAI